MRKPFAGYSQISITVLKIQNLAFMIASLTLF